MSKKLLLIDDEQAIAMALKVRLRAKGYEVQIAGDGVSGLAAAGEYRPDAIVLDIRMPDLDGIEVCRRLKCDPDLAGIPVIFLSANVQQTAQEAALSVGAAAYLSKPFEPGQVVSAIESATSSASAA